MKARAIPDYQRIEGFVRLSFLRRIEGAEAQFQLIIFGENLAVIKHFAGEEYEKAKYYPKDGDFLLELEEKVIHYEVFAEK
ncbi:MAG: antibiotic biosynthesis monooxygenase [Bacteroidota bacterium]